MIDALLYVVRFAEDHSGPGKARAPHFLQLDLAERALQAGRVPVAVEGVQEKAIEDAAAASGALLDIDGTEVGGRPRRRPCARSPRAAAAAARRRRLVEEGTDSRCCWRRRGTAIGGYQGTNSSGRLHPSSCSALFFVQSIDRLYICQNEFRRVRTLTQNSSAIIIIRAVNRVGIDAQGSAKLRVSWAGGGFVSVCAAL